MDRRYKQELREISPRILIAEHHIAVARGSGASFERSCKVVGILHDGEAAADAAAAFKPDVIELDI